MDRPRLRAPFPPAPCAGPSHRRVRLLPLLRRGRRPIGRAHTRVRLPAGLVHRSLRVQENARWWKQHFQSVGLRHLVATLGNCGPRLQVRFISFLTRSTMAGFTEDLKCILRLSCDQHFLKESSVKGKNSND